MRLYIVRHGETEYNKTGLVQGHSEVPLNDTGIGQIASVSRRVAADYDIDHIYASDLRRTAMSAAILAAHANVPLTFNPLFRERDPGDHTDKTFEEAIAFFTDLDHEPPNGESVPVFINRVERAMDHLIDLEGDTDHHIALVSHGMFLRAFMKVCFDRDPEEIETWPNSCLTIADYDGDGNWESILVADAAHLETQDPTRNATGA